MSESSRHASSVPGKPHEVAFVPNTSDGISVVAAGLDWRPGDSIVGAECEFPSNLVPWKRLEQFGVDYRRVEENQGRIDPEALFDRVDHSTRVLALSWVQYASGFRSDLRRIGAFCRDHDILFVVDSVQGLGAIRFDVERDLVDVSVGAAHKWLLGPEGIGLLYVSDRVVEKINPTRVGWRSIRRDPAHQYIIDYVDGAMRFETGTHNAMGIYALGASLELLLEIGLDRIEHLVLEHTRQLRRGLEDLGFEVTGGARQAELSGIVAAAHPRASSASLVEMLQARGILCSDRSDRVRIAPHFYTTEEEIDRLLNTLESHLRNDATPGDSSSNLRQCEPSLRRV